MLSNAVLTKVKTTYTPDGMGGYTQETIEEGTYDVQLSISDNVEEATAYGVSVESVLKVVSDVPLLDDEAGLYILKGADGVDGKDGSFDFSNLTDEQKQDIIKQLDLTGVKGDKGDKGDPGTNGADGKDGVSPTIETSKADGVTTLTITDVNGIKTATINDGKDGAQGPQGPKGDTGATPAISVSASVDGTSLDTPTVTVTKSGTDETPAFNLAFVGLKGAKGDKGDQGEKGADGTMTFADLTDEQKASLKGADGKDGTNGTDGVSPTIEVTETTTGHDVTITDVNGTKTFSIANGAKGDKGDTGATGPAYTLTDTDKQTIVDAVLASMTNAEEVSY